MESTTDLLTICQRQHPGQPVGEILVRALHTYKHAHGGVRPETEPLDQCPMLLPMGDDYLNSALKHYGTL